MRVTADTVYEVSERAAAVARGTLDLGTNIPERLAFPAHSMRCPMRAAQFPCPGARPSIKLERDLFGAFGKEMRGYAKTIRQAVLYPSR
jgi:hypothetical protein